MPVGPSRPIGLLPSSMQSARRPLFRAIGISASGLSAQRERMEVIATNLANAEVTRTSEGGPYRRQVARMEAATADSASFGGVGQPAVSGTLAAPQAPFGTAPFSVGGDSSTTIEVPVLPTDDGRYGVRIAEIATDPRDGKLVYEPGHPDADANGYVRYPNVDPTQEMVDLLDARRLYEANLTVLQSAKQMLRQALDI
jgi:flagellar basal-body rod protein FlgC